MTQQQEDPTHNIGTDPLEAPPSAGRGGSESDVIPEQLESAERSTEGSVQPHGESQEERGQSTSESPGHVSHPEEMSQRSQEGHH